MATHKRDLERHPALTAGPNRLLHEAIVVVDSDQPGRGTLFLDGREIVLAPAGARPPSFERRCLASSPEGGERPGCKPEVRPVRPGELGASNRRPDVDRR